MPLIRLRRSRCTFMVSITNLLSIRIDVCRALSADDSLRNISGRLLAPSDLRTPTRFSEEESVNGCAGPSASRKPLCTWQKRRDGGFKRHRQPSRAHAIGVRLPMAYAIGVRHRRAP
eukprot:6125057-Pleurochrysis_carterae.AAC.1